MSVNAQMLTSATSKSRRSHHVGSPAAAICHEPVKPPLGPRRSRHMLQEQVNIPRHSFHLAPSYTVQLTYIHTSRPLEWFFASGQVLPTHRVLHSPTGGLFQPTIVQAIRLLSSQPFPVSTTPSSPSSSSSSSFFSSSPSSSSTAAAPPHHSQLQDPFTDAGGSTYTSTGHDRFDAPSRYLSSRHSWVHVFPEAMIHQQAQMSMRYFKWGVSRLILESDPMPDMLPIFIDGTQKVMAEDRGFPRFLPRAGVTFRMAFGDLVDMEETFGDLRSKWQDLVRRQLLADAKIKKDLEEGPVKTALVMGELTDELKYGAEAVALRIEVTRRVREEVAKVRRQMGFPDEKPGLDLAQTWASEPPKDSIKSKVDNSLQGKRR